MNNYIIGGIIALALVGIFIIYFFIERNTRKTNNAQQFEKLEVIEENLVDKSSNQTILGEKTFKNKLSVENDLDTVENSSEIVDELAIKRAKKAEYQRQYRARKKAEALQKEQEDK